MFTENSVTVVTAATGHRHLRRCLSSVQQQTYPHLEHIVVVDGPEWLGRIQEAVGSFSFKEKPLRWMTLPHPTGKNKWNGHRIYAALSLLVNSQFVCFLDEDNWFDPEHIGSLVSALRSTHSQWGFSLRKIVDGEGNFITRDECESLGHLHDVYYAPGFFHIDANCYMLQREVAVQFVQAWYRPTRPPSGAEPDTLLCQHLLKQGGQGCTTCKYTVNYTVGNRPDSVRAEVFLRGNQVMRNRYPQGLPWERPARSTPGTDVSRPPRSGD